MRLLIRLKAISSGNVLDRGGCVTAHRNVFHIGTRHTSESAAVLRLEPRTFKSDVDAKESQGK